MVVTLKVEAPFFSSHCNIMSHVIIEVTCLFPVHNVAVTNYGNVDVMVVMTGFNGD